MIYHLGTQWLTFMAILQGSESVKVLASSLRQHL